MELNLSTFSTSFVPPMFSSRQKKTTVLPVEERAIFWPACPGLSRECRPTGAVEWDHEPAREAPYNPPSLVSLSVAVNGGNTVFFDYADSIFKREDS